MPEAQDFVAQEQGTARRASGGAAAAAGMPAYPLYGLGQPATVEIVPFYRRPMVTFVAGALLVGGAWLWFGFIKPKFKRNKKRGSDDE